MENNVIDMDFASLYPNVVTDFTKDPKFMREMREIIRLRLRRERLAKLKKLNSLCAEN